MARKVPPVHFDGTDHWFSLAHAAGLLHTTPRKLAVRVTAGEFRSEDFDDLGFPLRISGADVLAVRAVMAAKARESAAKKVHREKSPKRLEAEWAAISARNAKLARDGPFTNLHLKLTLPEETKPKRDG
ncbi:MAG: hypothetical protein ABI240_14715 [Sphingomonas sp.]